MPEQTAAIKYWIESANEYPLYYRETGELKGVYVQICEALSAKTGRETVLVNEKDGERISSAEALEMLRNGELDMVLGLSRELAKEDALIIAGSCIYNNTLAAVIPKGSPMILAETVGNYYWGIDSGIAKLIEGSLMEGHTLDFNGLQECVRVLQDGSVYGILVKASSLDYAVKISRESDYRVVPGIRINYPEAILMNVNNTELNEVISVVSAEYTVGQETSETAYILDREDVTAEYTNLLLKEYETGRVMTGAAFAGCALAIFFAILFAVVRRKLKSAKTAKEAIMQITADNEPDKELFEIDLKKERISAGNDFAIFRIAKGRISNPAELKELSVMLGYNFNEHFAKVAGSANTSYHNRLVIHMNGQKLLFLEDGKKSGHMLYLKVTDVTTGGNMNR